MKRNILYITCLFLILLGISCSDTIPVSKETSEKPVLFPDYADVTIPYNIAPLNFKIENPHAEAFAVLKFGEEKIQVKVFYTILIPNNETNSTILHPFISHMHPESTKCLSE